MSNMACVAIDSPHVLQLSDVGCAEHLSEIGVPIVHELKGVRRNMRVIGQVSQGELEILYRAMGASYNP